ncbi:MAG: three-Cys-motif partner protein TcmP, partial [Betaproteobacteria bacterium]
MDARLDPADELPAIECGEWSEDKHELLRQYIDCSHAARRRWLNGTNGATYIELFCGPGRLFIKGAGT